MPFPVEQYAAKANGILMGRPGLVPLFELESPPDRWLSASRSPTRTAGERTGGNTSNGVKTCALKIALAEARLWP